MKIARHFTKDNVDPFHYIKWREASTTIKNENTGEIVYHVENAEVPAPFSQISQDIILSKYLRLTGVPSKTVKVIETTPTGRPVPVWLQRSIPAEGCQFGGESSAKQVFHRLAGFWTYWGWWNNYFDNESDAKAFYDESIYMLECQLVAPNTPQWYNSGIYWAYGLTGKKKGFYKANPSTGIAIETENSYEFPGLHACFINSVGDNLFEDDGIFTTIVNEARGFVTGGGTGSNFSAIRSKFEKLSSGNQATGLMSFLKIFDRSAGVVKSGSSQRRAAKMVIVDMDHPEIPEYIEWKEVEERKVQALANGGFDAGWEGEAYSTVSGQNSNNSIRIPNKFIDAVARDLDWSMTSRTTGQVVRTMKARELWGKLTRAAWASGDPGIQFDDIIQEWHTCSNDGKIKASNPCAEFLFNDDTACNLATLNLQRLFDSVGQLNIGDFRYAVNHWMMVLDISIDAAQLPTKRLAEGTLKYRTTGLGHSGIGAVLMKSGIPYDSDQACHLMAAISALMCGESYAASAKMAKALGAFPRYNHNKEVMHRVIRNHQRAATGNAFSKSDYEKLTVKPWEIDHTQINIDLSVAIKEAWDQAAIAGEAFGYRNAFTTLIQPSGTVGLLLGCDTTAIEPDFGIVKFKRLSGGGSMKIVNDSVETALANLGYSDSQVDDIMCHVLGNNTLEGAPHVNRQSLLERGITDRDIDDIEGGLGSIIQLRYAVTLNKLSEDSLQALGLDRKKDVNVNVFSFMGFTAEQYIEANQWICGYGTLEGAPHLKPEHLPIFDCANRSGYGSRFIRWEAHVRACSAVSPFVSGAISKTFNMPKDATEKDVESVYGMAFDGRNARSYCPGGIKCFAIYRDGCKAAQPLNNPTSMDWWSPSERDNKAYFRGERKRPPRKRELVAHEITIYGREKQHKVIIKFGEYEDGSLCEVWIDVSKENPDFFLSMKWAARAISNAIQYGQPMREIADSFINEEGGPAGRTNHPYITYCSSIPDLVVKLAMLEYEGDITYCRRTPQQHEVRKGVLNARNGKNGNGHSGGHKPLPQLDVVLERNTIMIQKGRGCPKCGSMNIQKFPCEQCLSCGSSLGGCSP